MKTRWLGDGWKRLIKRITIIVGVLALLMIAAFLGFWLYNRSQCQPLYGNFDIGTKCMGGHEVFLDLDTRYAYYNCPGHRDRRKIGNLVRAKDSVTIFNARDDSPFYRIDWDGSAHSLSFLKMRDSDSVKDDVPVRRAISQVTNPSRLWLPTMLPE